MSLQPSQEIPESLPDEQDVVRYLREHTHFFERHPDLLACMRIPHLEAGNAVSLVERQVQRLRHENEQQQKRLANLLEIAHTNDRLGELTHRLLLDLMGAQDLTAALDLLAARLYEDFSADRVSIRLAVAPRRAEFAGREEFVRDIPGFEQLFGKFLAKNGEVVCGRLSQEQRDYLFADRAAQIASVALLPIGDTRNVGLIAIGSHDAARFHPGVGTVFLERMAAVVSRILQPQLESR